MLLEKITESLKNCEPDKALIYAEKALAFAKEQCGGSVPSGEHGYLEELAGLLRVTRLQRDQSERGTLRENIQNAQVQAGEAAVLANLERLGL